MCDHPKGLWFKCPRRKETSKCVQCLLCLIKTIAEDGSDTTACTSLVPDDYEQLPEMPEDVYQVAFQIAEQAHNFRVIKNALKEGEE